jgi:hypothetical protein
MGKDIFQTAKADRKTKWFLFNWLIYGLALILTLVYCYLRLDFVRSGPKKTASELMQHVQEP